MQSEQMFPKGDVLPDTCKVGDTFILILRSSNQATLFICLTDNAWTALAGNDSINYSPAVVLV